MSYISIIIIVKNDKGIQATLSKLRSIKKLDKTETIVIDASNGKLDYIKKKFNDVNWYAFKNYKKTITIPEQRNLGIKNAKGNIIVFIDSDCIPDKNWLYEVTKYIINGSEKIVGGNTNIKGENSFQKSERIKKMKNKYIDEAPTMNIAYSKEVFDAVGLFDESFQYGSDVDFSWRAIQSGFKIRLNPKAIIYHDLGDIKSNVRRMYLYGKARMRLYRKHKYKWKIFILSEASIILYPIFFLLLPISLVLPYYPLFILIPILNNNNKNPLYLITMKTMFGIGIISELFFPYRYEKIMF